MANIILKDNLDLNLVLDDRAEENTESVIADVFFRYEDEPDKEPVYLGSAPSGKTLKVPFDFSPGKPIRVFVVSKTESGDQSVYDAKEGEQAVFNPNLESETPVIGQLTDATNTQVQIGVNNFSGFAKHRKVEIADDSGFTTGVVETIQNASEFAGNALPGNVIVTKTGEAGTVTKFIRVSHSSNGETYGTLSNTISVTFADSGGGGGTGGGFDPCFLGDMPFTFFDGGSVNFEYLYDHRDRYIGRPMALSFDDKDKKVRGIIDAVFRHEVDEYLKVTFTDGEVHHVTKHHRYYKGFGKYIAIGDVADEQLCNTDGTFAGIKSVEQVKLKFPAYVYNARVRVYKNYSLGKKRVHNAKQVDL